MLRRMTIFASLLLTTCVYAGQADFPLTSEESAFVPEHSHFSHVLDQMWKNKGGTENDIDRIIAKKNLAPRQNKMEKVEVNIGGNILTAYMINTCAAAWAFDDNENKYKYIKGTFYTEGGFKFHELIVSASAVTTATPEWERLNSFNKFKRADTKAITRNPLYSFCLEMPSNSRSITIETRNFKMDNAPEPRLYVLNLRLTNSKEPDEVDKKIFELERESHKALHLKNAYDLLGMPLVVSEEDSYAMLLNRQEGNMDGDVIDSLKPTSPKNDVNTQILKGDPVNKNGKVSF
jgi:hypothetical protein